jgi:glycosyltransferase involved in cell wall biosynthesis
MKNILIIGFVWPEPNSSAAGSRMLQLIEAFLSEGAKITFASTASDSDFMFDVQQLGINKVSIELNNSNFDTFVRELNPEIVLFDRFMVEEQFGWRVAKECPNALRILDTEDLHCLRSARQLAVKEKREFNTTDLFSDTSKREVASIFRSDITLIISTFEMKILTENFKVDPSLLLHLPFFLDPISELTITNWKSFEERIDFAFIGNFLHEPNWDAVKYLKEEIWPLIKKELPDSKINIYGAYPSQKVNQLHNEKEGFLIKGRAQSASEVIENARVTIVPLRFGAGIKGKLVESMQCGTPSITTSIGAESMHGNLPWSGFIENETSEIAKKSIELYTSKSTWLEAQKKGINIINSIYSKKDNSSLFLSNVKQIQQNIEQHRINNFTGAMLMHHTLASTKYMSKWIEEKNLKMS